MPNIFDQLASERKSNIFDELASERKKNVFDQMASAPPKSAEELRYAAMTPEQRVGPVAPEIRQQRAEAVQRLQSELAQPERPWSFKTMAEAALGGAVESATETVLVGSALASKVIGEGEITKALDQVAAGISGSLFLPDEASRREAAEINPVAATVGSMAEMTVDPAWMLTGAVSGRAAGAAVKASGISKYGTTPLKALFVGEAPKKTFMPPAIIPEAKPTVIPLGTTKTAGEAAPVVAKVAEKEMVIPPESIQLRKQANALKEKHADALAEYGEMTGRKMPQTPTEKISPEAGKSLSQLGKSVEGVRQNIARLESQAKAIEEAAFEQQVKEAGGVLPWLNKVVRDEVDVGYHPGRIDPAMKKTIVRGIRKESERTGIRADLMVDRMEEARAQGVPDKDLLAAIANDTTVKTPETFSFSYPRGLAAPARSLKRLMRQGKVGFEMARYWGSGIARESAMEGTWTMGMKPIFKGLNEAQKKNLIDFIEGYAPALNPEIEKRAGKAKELFDAIFKTGVNVDKTLEKQGLSTMGIKDHYIEKYFPHHVDMSKMADLATQKKLAATAVERGLVSPGEVNEFVSGLNSAALELSESPYINPFARFKAIKRSGNVEFTRKINEREIIKMLTDLGIMDRSEAGMRRYIKSVSTRFAHAEQWGAKNDRFVALRELMGKDPNGADLPFVDALWENHINPSNKQRSRYLQAFENLFIRPVQNISKTMVLPLTPISQAMAMENLALYPMKTVAQGAWAWARHPIKTLAEYRNFSALLNEFESVAGEQMAADKGAFAKIAEWSGMPLKYMLKGIGANAVDRTTRALFFAIGKPQIETLFGDVSQSVASGKWTRKSENAAKSLDMFFPEWRRIVSDRGAKTVLTPEELGRGAATFADLAAGNPNKAQIQNFATTGYGRLWADLKRTGMQQAGYQVDHALNPALRYIATGGKKGTIAPLLKFTATSLPLGYLGGYIKDLAQRRDSPDPFTMAGIAQAMTNSFYLGFVADGLSRILFSAYGRYGGELEEGAVRMRTPKEMATKAVEALTPMAVSVPVGMLSGRKPSLQKLTEQALGIEEEEKAKKRKGFKGFSKPRPPSMRRP